MPEYSHDFNPEDLIKKPEEASSISTIVMAESSAIVPAQEEPEDPICLTIKEDDVPDAVLKAVLWGLAEEQASLKSLRQQKAKDGKDTAHISIKRGQLLKYMSETLLQKQALMGQSGGEIDLRGPKFREIFKMFLGIIADTFDEIRVPIEYKEMFFHALSRNMEGWEDKAEKVIKKMSRPINIPG
jgi:hypothetical protein